MDPHAATLLLFTRLDAPDLLAHATRRALIDRARENPGATVGSLARDEDIHYKTAAYHARALERAGQLVLVREGRALACYLPGAPREPVPALTTRERTALDALDAGARTAAMIARALATTRGSAWTLLLTLRKRGLAERREGEWRARRDRAHQGFIGGPSMGER